jgi:hypothetical protein
MIPINNSDTAWLITTDFNQEHNLPYEDLKQDIISPDTNQWVFEEDYGGVKLETVIHGVGGTNDYVGYEDITGYPTVGGHFPRVIFVISAPVSLYVGGHRQFPMIG